MKGKGKIHPTPASLPVVGAAAGSSPPQQSHDTLAVLSLLPAAILALTAALGSEDKEVLAYLVMRSIESPAAAAEERRHCRRPRGSQHQPVFGCGCFDCYTGFWSRWDCSPDRELIHQAIEAFEEHLASSEKKGGAGSRGRRRERKAAERAEKGRKGKGKEEARTKAAEVENDEKVEKALELATVGGAESFAGEEVPVAADAVVESAAVEDGVEVAAAATGERRKGWADVMGIFNSRLWGLWSPGA